MKHYRTGYTQGVYDMFHVGHLNLINRAKACCDRLIVGVNADALVEQYKHKTPVIPQEDRRAIVENLKAVDACVIVETLDKMETWKALGFDAIFIGDDWKGNARWEQTAREMAEVGVDVVFLPHTDGITSTMLRPEKDRSVDDAPRPEDAK